MECASRQLEMRTVDGCGGHGSIVSCASLCGGGIGRVEIEMGRAG